MRVQIRAKRRASHTVPATHLANVRRRFEACEQELTSAVSYLQRTAEEERRRLARALHDDLGGALTAAKIDLHVLRARSADDAVTADRFDRVSRTIDEAVAIERRAVELLRPSLLEYLGLAAAIEHSVSARCQRAGLACQIDSLAAADSVLGDQAIIVYRLVQEGLANIIEGKTAHWMGVSLTRDASGFRLALSDDSRVPAKRAALDERLASMRQRAISLGGHLEVRRGRRGGSIEVRFP